MSRLARAGLLRPSRRDPVHAEGSEGVVDRKVLPGAEHDRSASCRRGWRQSMAVHPVRQRRLGHMGRRLDEPRLRFQRCAGARRLTGRASRELRARHRGGGTGGVCPRQVHPATTILPSLKIARITPEELKRRLDAGDADLVVIDTRSALDVNTAPYTIPGALWIAAEEMDRRGREVPRDREIVLYCT